jgi:predicted AAA+ superfamily ATPase
LKNGGLPGVCFLRNDRLRSEQIRSQLQLILDRDIRLVYPTSLSFAQILEFVTQLSSAEGGPVHSSRLRKSTGITEVTQKKLLHALEAVFCIRLLPIEGDRRGVCVYFEDQAEQLSLLTEKPDPLRQFEGLVYRNLRATFFYETGCDFRFFQYRARPDVRIPFAIRTKDGCLGIFPILESKPTKAQIRMAHRFLQRYSPATVLFVTLGLGETVVLEPRILQIPAEALLFEE